MTLRPWANRFIFVIFAVGFIMSFLPVETRATRTADSIPRMTIQELKDKMDKGDRIVILDVRSAQDYNTSSYKITGAVRIPLDQLKNRYTELPAAAEIVAYCTWHDEATSARAARILIDLGFKKVSALKGGWHAWKDAQFPMEPKQ